MTAEKIYIVADIQDLSDRSDVSLEGARDFLRGLWMNDRQEDVDFDLDEFFEKIAVADVKELSKMLGGCDYTIYESEEEYLEQLQEQKIEELEKKCDTLSELIGELDDAVGFMEGFSGEPTWIGCACEARDMESEDCICLEDGEPKRVQDKRKAIEKGEMFLNQLKTELEDLKINKI